MSLKDYLRKRHANNGGLGGEKELNQLDKKKKVKTVKDIEINKKYLPLRIILFVLFLAGGIVAIVLGVTSTSQINKGWYAIESLGGKSLAGDFMFLYYFDSDDTNVNKSRYNDLTSLYTSMSEEAYFTFSSIEETDKTNNIYYLNNHINTEVEVSSLLYNSIKKCNDANNKVLYMAPIFEQYENIFNADNDAAAKNNDPYYNNDIADYFDEISSYVNNGDIYFELLSDNKVKLNISNDYLSYCSSHNITKYVDFAYLTDALALDYFADTLDSYGAFNYRISSFEGYVRTNTSNDILGSYALSYSYYARYNNYVMPVANLQFNRPLSLVEFKKFPIVSMEQYYLYADHTLVHHFLDNSGRYISSTDSLYLYDYNHNSVTDLLLSGSDVFIKDTFDFEALNNLGCQFIYHDGSLIKTNDDLVTFKNLVSVNFCSVCHRPFNGEKCPYDESTSFEAVTFTKEVI